jgi:hypothetical protein
VKTGAVKFSFEGVNKSRERAARRAEERTDNYFATGAFFL